MTYAYSSPEVIRLVVMMYIRYPQECGRWLNNRADGCLVCCRRYSGLPVNETS
jgi:hypothetical protein